MFSRITLSRTHVSGTLSWREHADAGWLRVRLPGNAETRVHALPRYQVRSHRDHTEAAEGRAGCVAPDDQQIRLTELSVHRRVLVLEAPGRKLQAQAHLQAMARVCAGDW